MEWSIVITLLVFGLGLVIAEIIFVPGTTIVGFLGFALMVTGAALSFRYFGSETGWTVVGCTAVASGVVLYYSFKTNVWGRFALRSSVQGKVNDGEMEGLAEGQEGVALSALRPIGKAEWNSKTYEVRTRGEYVASGTKIRIINISSNQITVEPTT
jgi:membrane-bound ClpP family serine protease